MLQDILFLTVSAFYGGGPSLPLSDRKALVSAWAEQAKSLDMDLIVEIGAGPFVEVLAFVSYFIENHLQIPVGWFLIINLFSGTVLQSIQCNSFDSLRRDCIPTTSPERRVGGFAENL